MDTVKPAVTTASHPLDPLGAEELERAVAILRRDRGLTADHRFVYIAVKESPKPEVLAFVPGKSIDPRALAIIRDRARRVVIEAEVSITRDAVTEWTERRGVQAPITLEEVRAAEEVIRNDPRWQAAMRKRGVSDFGLATIDPWPAGYNGPEDAPDSGRFALPLTWVRSG